jgi:hypothetical protein
MKTKGKKGTGNRIVVHTYLLPDELLLLNKIMAADRMDNLSAYLRGLIQHRWELIRDENFCSVGFGGK